MNGDIFSSHNVLYFFLLFFSLISASFFTVKINPKSSMMCEIG